MRFTVLVEQTPSNFGAWSPELPGCVAVADTVEETLVSMREAIAMHLAGMREDGVDVGDLGTHEIVAEPGTKALSVDVAA